MEYFYYVKQQQCQKLQEKRCLLIQQYMLSASTLKQAQLYSFKFHQIFVRYYITIENYDIKSYFPFIYLIRFLKNHINLMNGKQLAVILAIIGAASVLLNYQNASPVSEFESWKATHGVNFASQFENAYREKIFLSNLAKINAHNNNQMRTYDMGVNQFSGLTQEQFAQQYLGANVPEHLHTIDSTDDLKVGDIDWESQGAVTPVKNQGQCGSCWAFSATGGLEGLSKIAYGALESFSEQQLVDCSAKYGNNACNGGLMDNAFKFVKDNGIVHEDQYPYKAVKQTCSKTGGPFKISGFTDIKDCNTLATALVGRPISVAVDASNWSAYKTGVFNGCKTQLNHGVTLVGINDNYWVIKNSWGPTWGEKGHIRLARGNTCGVCNVASYPNK